MAISNLPKLNFSVPFAMTAALPLEYNAYFSTLAEAQAAAQTAEQPGSTNTIYYFGQKIVVVTDSSADLYIIQPDKSLKEAGSIPVGDGKSITVSDAGVIGLVGFEAATANQQPRKKSDGTIEWFTPDTSSVSGLQETVGQHTTQIAALEGDVTTINGQIETINTNLGKKADADSVYTKITGLADALGNKVDKEVGKGLSSNDFTDALLNKLNAVADDAQVNVIDSVSDEFEVSAEKKLSVKAIASDKITGLQGALDTKIEQVKVAGTALTITNKAVDIPAATAALLGVVKVDDVTIGSADGVISVKAVSTDLFQQGTDTLIWNGGTAQG